ncbi:hypothetical protein [Microbacterium sp. A93]|uniref:hypothetical protein n=1 Tax=Microbacterium sp. A93 TaxID=3450716 RepID=UPI003F438EC7
MTETTAGQPRLERKARTHPQSLAAQRAGLAAPHHPPAVRGLATQPTSEPGVALLDAFAMVVDIVCFYSERHATEGYLRTATERRSVRELARTLGHELRPGLSASADLVFQVEDAGTGEREATVPAGTPVQSIPGPGQVPQVFETGEDLQAHAAWNEIPAAATEPQVLRYGAREVWLRGGNRGLRRGDAVLIAGDERLQFRPGTSSGVDEESFDLRRLDEVTVDPPDHPGWTLLRLDRTLGFLPFRPLVGTRRQRIWHLPERGRLFGATAPDPGLLRIGPDGQLPPGSTGPPDRPGQDRTGQDTVTWDGFDLPEEDAPTLIEVAGDQPSIIPGSWVVLEQEDKVEAYVVKDVQASGMLRFGISGPVTRVLLDTGEKLERYDRRAAMVHYGSVEIPEARRQPRGPVGGEDTAVLDLEPFLPLLPGGHRVLVSGTDVDGLHRVEEATVLDCRETLVDAGPRGEPLVQPQRLVRLTLTAATAHRYRVEGLVVHGNVAAATHGSTTTQVLGSGDGFSPYLRFALRHPPLTHVRPGEEQTSEHTATGAVPALEVHVDGVRWHEVEGFESARATDRVYRLEHSEPRALVDGAAPGPLETDVVFGDGIRGVIPPSGSENIVAVYRAGIGEAGALVAGQLSLPMRRPLGIREVDNPGPTRDWAPPESLAEARRTAPQRIRTLDRVVSVADFEDLARNFAGVGQAAAEQVWDGRTSTVVLSVRGTAGVQPSEALLAALAVQIEAVRDPRMPFRVVRATLAGCGVGVDVATDPDHRREQVLREVRDELVVRHGAGVRRIGQPMTAAEILVSVRSVPGVLYCTMPVLRRTGPTGRGDRGAPDHSGTLLVARGAHWETGGAAGPAGSPPVLHPAELLALLPAGVVLSGDGLRGQPR